MADGLLTQSGHEPTASQHHARLDKVIGVQVMGYAKTQGLARPVSFNALDSNSLKDRGTIPVKLRDQAKQAFCFQIELIGIVASKR
jgi:hypothetical protein